MLHIIVVGQHGSAVQVAGDDGGTSGDTLKDHGLTHQGIEVAALGVLGLLESLFELIGVVEVGIHGSELNELVHIIAQLGQQSAVQVPAILGGGVLQTGHGVHAHAVIAVGLGALPDAIGNGGQQIRAVGGVSTPI